MIDGAMPKPLQDLLALFVLAAAAGGILLGSMRDCGRPKRGASGKDGMSIDGWLGDDGPHHHGDSGSDGH